METAPHSPHNIEVSYDDSADGEVAVKHPEAGSAELPEVNEIGEPLETSHQLEQLMGATALEASAEDDKAA